MSVLLENITNYIWQAFEALRQDKSGLVHKSRLKVLTANIGTLLDLYGVERGLEHFRSTTTLNFDQFKYYLQQEVFTSLPAKLQMPEMRIYESRIAEVCWLVCRNRILNRPNCVFSDQTIYQIFRIFNVLAELVPASHDCYQVLLHSSEAGNIAQTLANSLGCEWDDEDFANLSLAIGSFPLIPFMAVLETRSLGDVKDNNAIVEAVTDIYQTVVEDVIKKGYLNKKGYIFPTMREYWFVLRPSELTFYKNRNEKTLCGSLAIEPGSRVEPKTEGYKIVLHTPERVFELATNDHMTRLQWISALQLAIEQSGNNQSFARFQAARRRLQRHGRTQEMLKAKMQLQHERNARQVAEGQAKELEAVVREEAKKLTDLEQLRDRLEHLLEEETQAKRDEEIVRTLQARVLAEEWEKREELEQLQEEQRLLLEQERGKRLEFECLQSEKERQLKDAEERLEQLEKERQILDEQLKLAHFKIKQSEDKKEVLERRLYQVAPTLRHKDGIRRAQSFMPSTKEKPVIVQVKSSTLTKQKYNNN